MPELKSLLKPPYIFLILGVVSISAATVFTCTARFGGKSHFVISVEFGSSDSSTLVGDKTLP
jgi:hypothetical protein